MQDRYAGDAGDWSKLGLLRALGGTPTGIVWYRVADESHNDDGKHRAWMDQPARYRPQDPALFDALLPLREGERTVRRLAALGAPGWVSVEDLVPTDVTARTDWVRRAVAAVAGCEVVCLDPDNGLFPPSVRRGSRVAPKFAGDDEVAAFAAVAPVVVVYQHLHRRGTAADQAAAFAARLRAANAREIAVVRYRRGTSRLYGVAHPPGHAVEARLAAFVDR
jgi:hypothetical protein